MRNQKNENYTHMLESAEINKDPWKLISIDKHETISKSDVIAKSANGISIRTKNSGSRLTRHTKLMTTQALFRCMQVLHALVSLEKNELDLSDMIADYTN